jgi:NTE family protein
MLSSLSKKIGLALGSGSARGWSHIGVIRALEEAGIKIDFVAGTSIGAFVGAFYSSGNLDYMEAFALQMDWKAIISFFDVGFPRKGLLDGEKIYQLVSKEILTENIEETEIPFRTVATNLMTGKDFIFKTGSIVDAVRASISIPGIFTPFKKDNYNLVDGGLINPVPVDVVRNMGADIVIAVDLNHDLVENQSKMKSPQSVAKDSLGKKIDDFISGSNIKAINTLKEKYQNIEKSVSVKLKEWTPDKNDMNIFEIIGTSINIMEHRITQNNLEIHKPDILIQPSLGHLGLFDFDQAAETIEEGRVVTKKVIDKILNMMNSYY